MATADRSKQYYCERCNKTLRADEFYTSNNLEKYPNDGKMPMCKQCLTAHVNNWDPETYLWILQEIDVPYVPEEWTKLMASYARDGKKITGTSILGRYLSKMKLVQYKKYRWSDTEFLQELANNKIEQTMKRQGYSAADIQQAIQKATYSMPEGELKEPAAPPPQEPWTEDYFDRQSGADSDFNDDLTEEDRTYLRLKWGKTYKPEEWIRLEQLYEEMMASYDIQSAGHIDTLKLICKTSLKANQLIDIGDIEGFQKMSKVYDSLMKSGKFTALQNKEEGDFIDSVGELIELCEKRGYIERYYIEEPKDKVDFAIQDMQRYTRTLIEEETHLSSMIEHALKVNQKEDQDSDNNIDNEIVDDSDLSIEDLEKTIKDSDYEEFNDFIESELEIDELLYDEGDDE